MKITRENVGTGLRSFLQSGRKASFYKHLFAKILEETYEYGILARTRIEEISPNDQRIRWNRDVLLSYEKKRGYTSLLEQYILISILKLYQSNTFFEIGTFDGQTTYALARNCPTLRLFTLDIEENKETAFPISNGEQRYIKKPIIGMKFFGTKEAARINQLFGDSATFDYSPYFGRMDVVFIDGCHDEIYVRNDTKKALTLLSDHGIILWHDYLHYDSVTRVLEELGASLPLLHVQETSLVVYLRS